MKVPICNKRNSLVNEIIEHEYQPQALSQQALLQHYNQHREKNACDYRVCDSCYDRLDPLQAVLINTISNAVQVAKHDVTDWTCARGWINLPIGLSMEHEIYKASNTLRNYCQVAKSNPEKSIPLAVLKSAKGLAILTVVKAGALLSYKLGTGLVVARRSDGSWSAPSAIFSLGLGWGAQVK
ncbi:hypothetical protein RIF29_34262 [Crotalaria pallida]|uniref:Uncharacterized protein n=1 Tax=Crotalaria pallida TaxID=3830 RepID=A0AAN9EAZ4_CROPI